MNYQFFEAIHRTRWK